MVQSLDLPYLSMFIDTATLEAVRGIYASELKKEIATLNSFKAFGKAIDEGKLGGLQDKLKEVEHGIFKTNSA